MIKVYARAFGQAGQPMDVAATAELDRALRYIDAGLAPGPFLLGTLFTAADIQLSFVPELAASMGSIAAYPNIVAWLARLHARPAFRRSVEAGVSYRFAD
jgi:glutathione S-transferase